MKMLSGLRSRMILLVLIAVFPAMGFMLYASTAQQRLAEQQANQEARGKVATAAESHQRSIEEARGLLQGLSHIPAVRERDSEACETIFREIMESAPRYANLGAVSLDGSVFCSALPIAAGHPVDLSDRHYFRRVVQTKDFALGDYQVGRITRKATLNVAYPSLDENGELDAVVYAALDLDWIATMTNDRGLPPGSLLMVLDGNGALLAQFPRNDAQIGDSAAGLPLIERMLRDREGVTEGCGFDGVSRMFAFAPMNVRAGASGSLVAVGIPTDEITGHQSRIFDVGLLGIAIAALLAIAAAWQGGNILVLDKVKALLRTTQRLSAGDLGARADLPPGSDELSVFARSFDDMARSLEQLTRQNRLILESASEGICGLDREGRITFANRAAAALTGREVDELLGASLHDLVHDDGAHTRATCPLLSPLESGARRHDAEETFLRSGGSTFPVECDASPIIEGEKTIGVGLIFRDISDRRKLEEQFRQAQKMDAIGRLAGGVAHDFNNLLTVIMGFAGLLRRKLPPDDQSREDVDQIVSASERAADLTRQLLAFSRRQVLDAKVIDFSATVGGMTPMIARLIGEDIELSTDLDPNVGHVRADPGQIEQILLNLAVNARDALPRGGKLTIATMRAEEEDTLIFGRRDDRPPKFVMLSVSDSGVGMDAETQARVFEPFFTTKELGKGTGLGLSTVYGIVKQSGGEIVVDSAPGRGTTFSIYLPSTEAPSAPEDGPVALPEPKGGSETILVVEDEERIRSLVTRALRGAGYAVLEAKDAALAIAAAAEHKGSIDLLVSDIVMPKMTGLELASALSVVRPSMKTLYMSGYADGAIAEHGLPAGASYLSKPFRPDALLARVREMLDA